MGFGGLFKKQNQLTTVSNGLAIEAGKAKQEAANKEASALRTQGALIYKQTQEEKALFQRQAAIEIGHQDEQYLSSGVYLQGTPLAVGNEARKLAQFKLDTMEEHGILAQDLMRARADILEQSGLADYLTAEASTVINSLENEINQQSTKSSFYRSLFGGLAHGGLSILGGLV